LELLGGGVQTGKEGERPSFREKGRQEQEITRARCQFGEICGSKKSRNARKKSKGKPSARVKISQKKERHGPITMKGGKVFQPKRIT